MKQTSHTVNIWTFVVFADARMDEDSSMTVDWGEFLHHVILNPVDSIGELVTSWKHQLVRRAGRAVSLAPDGLLTGVSVHLSIHIQYNNAMIKNRGR